MLLSTLLADHIRLSPEADRPVTALSLNSEKIEKNSLFLAVQGTHGHGKDYTPQAIAKGAAAVCVESASPSEPVTFQDGIPIVPVYQLKAQIGALAARFYGEPAKALHIIGVTGTSGKTTCAHFLAQSLQSLYGACGMIGTLGCGEYGKLQETGLTTPDALTLHQAFRAFRDRGTRHVAMEVSSHSIDQGRINAIPFPIGIFTNLTQDHLDYHGNMESYAAVKRRFFSEWAETSIINADDAYGSRWINELAAKRSVIAYGIERSQRIPSHLPYLYTKQIAWSAEGIIAALSTPWGETDVKLPLIGQFNLSNSLAVVAALVVSGVSLTQAANCLTHLTTVPGRMQCVSVPGKPLVVVDYAHKPDALEKVLRALRHHTKGKLICVFGCGGNRDRTKRPLMAQIAEKWADRVIVTNDNPRHEAPAAIAAEICAGFTNPQQVVIELDRAAAIASSIQTALPGDCVLIAGKGAEYYQQIGDNQLPFNDLNEVKQLLF